MASSGGSSGQPMAFRGLHLLVRWEPSHPKRLGADRQHFVLAGLEAHGRAVPGAVLTGCQMLVVTCLA
jgi:hypothetical protein